MVARRSRQRNTWLDRICLLASSVRPPLFSSQHTRKHSLWLHRLRSRRGSLYCRFIAEDRGCDQPASQTLSTLHLHSNGCHMDSYVSCDTDWAAATLPHRLDVQRRRHFAPPSRFSKKGAVAVALRKYTTGENGILLCRPCLRCISGIIWNANQCAEGRAYSKCGVKLPGCK